MCRTKIKSLRNFTMLKNCAHVKLASCKATKKATIEDEETTSIPVAMGDEAIVITSSCNRGHLDIKKYGAQASNMN